MLLTKCHKVKYLVFNSVFLFLDILKKYSELCWDINLKCMHVVECRYRFGGKRYLNLKELC